MDEKKEPTLLDFIICGFCDAPLQVVLYRNKPWLGCVACKRLHVCAPIRKP